MNMREESLNSELQEKDVTLNEEQITVQSENDATETIAETSTEAEVVTKESLIAAATALAEKPAEEIGRDEVARLRQQFNAIRKEELDATPPENTTGRPGYAFKAFTVALCTA